MKRLLALLATLALATTALAQQDYENVDPSGQTVLFWHQHTGSRQAYLAELVAQFNAENPYGITVIEENQGGYGDIFNKMLVLLGTNDVPNVVVAYQNQAATYQVVDGLIDIWPLVRSERWGLTEDDLADFFEGFLQSDVNPVFDNKLLGFPPNRSGEVLYFNLEWLQELGFDGAPTNPEEFAAAARAAVAQPFSRAAEGRSLGYEISLDASRFASWTFAFGGDIYDYETNRFTLNSDAAVAAMTFLQGLAQEGAVAVITESFGDQTNFGQGRTLFTVGSNSGFPFYREAVAAGVDFEWSVGPVPYVGSEPVLNVYGASVSIPVGHSPEAELATWEFLKFYTSPEIQANWVRASGYFPVRASVAAGLDDYFAADPAFAVAFDLLQYGHAEPPAPGYDFVRSIMVDAFSAIIEGADVVATLNATNEEANQILDEQLAEIQ